MLNLEREFALFAVPKIRKAYSTSWVILPSDNSLLATLSFDR
jgi:hypothetical protein